MAKPASPKRPPAKKTASASRAIDTALVRDIADLLAGTDLTEIEVEKGDLRIRVARGSTAPAFAAPAPVSVSVATPPATIVTAPSAVSQAESHEDHPGAVTSPMVGTAYRRPNPEAKPFVDIGSTVAVGDRVLLVEAMKTFNEIVAHRAGTVSAILVEDGQPVEYGQALMIID